MQLSNFIRNLFIKEPSNPYNVCAKTIRRMGYKKIEDGTFIKGNSSGRTMIWLSEQGIRIKVYAFGYGESDFLPSPLPDPDRLIKFISENEI